MEIKTFDYSSLYDKYKRQVDEALEQWDRAHALKLKLEWEFSDTLGNNEPAAAIFVEYEESGSMRRKLGYQK